MKSVVQEASSIAKAIEQAWSQAGKPQEFTIKVLEQPQKNFIGFTTHSAKVALYFEEVVQKTSDQRPRRPNVQQQRQPGRDRGGERGTGATATTREPGKLAHDVREVRPQAQTRDDRAAGPAQDQHIRRDRRDQRDQRDQRERKPDAAVTVRDDHRESQRENQREPETPQWNEAMVLSTKQWLHDTLSSMNLSHVIFSIEPNGMYLRIALHEQLVPEPDKERQLLASFSTLILDTLKKEFKTGLRGHRVILTHATSYEKYAN